MNLAEAAAKPKPAAVPISSISPTWRPISMRTCPEPAPSAMRIPISRVRRATLYASTP